MKKNYMVILGVIIPVFVYWFMVYILCISRGKLILLMPSLFASIIILKFILDNSKMISFRNVIIGFPLAIILYIPIAICVAPALYASSSIESYVYMESEKFHSNCQDKIKNVRKERQKKIQVLKERDQSHWYKPWTWGQKVKYVEEVMKTEVFYEPITEKAALWSRMTYGAITSALDIITMLLRIFDIFLIFKSFLYVYSQSIICRTKIRTKI